MAFCGTASNPRAFASGSWAVAGAAASAATSPAVSAAPLSIHPKGYPNSVQFRRNRPLVRWAWLPPPVDRRGAAVTVSDAEGGALVSTGAQKPLDACRVGLTLVNHEGNDTKANDNVELALAA